MEINFWWLTAMVAAACLAGFCMGRIAREGRETAAAEKSGEKERRRGWPVGSPVSGEILDVREGERPVMMISPKEGRLYAPAAGKIIKLFPLGNALLFKTEFGTELYIQAGDSGDELLGRFYRPRVVRNEIVAKGKLLLEFDREGLEAEGASPEVLIAVESRTYGSGIAAVADGFVRTGEEVFRVLQNDEYGASVPAAGGREGNFAGAAR